MGKIKVIVKRPDEKYGHVTNISATLANLQKTVDGYIETLTLPGFTIICNEEGIPLGLERNCMVYGFTFFGTIVVAGVKGDNFDDVGISFEEWKTIIDESNGGRS